MPVWALVVAAVAALRIAAALALYLSGATVTAIPTPIPLVAYAGLSLTFSALGTLLVVANRNDIRAAWFGGVLLLLAVQMTTPLLAPSSVPIGRWIDRIRPDALLPAFLWFFLIEFPSRLAPAARRAARVVAVGAAAMGLAALAINLSLLIWPADGLTVEWRSLLTSGRAPGSIYWLAVFLPSAAAFVALLGRMAATSGADRRRLQIFIGGTVAGLLPLVLGVLIEESWPAFKTWVHTPAVEPWMGLVLFGALATVPFVTTYSVVFDHVVEIRVVVRTALQYLLARYTILVVSALPFIALAVYLARVQAESPAALLSEPRPQALLLGALAGAVALRMRQPWLDALDRRFFREQYDAQLLLGQIMSDDFISQRPVEIAKRLSAAFERTLHARADLFVIDEAGATLRDPRGERPPLGVKASLVALALAHARPMDVQLSAGTALDHVTDAEKAWLAAGGYSLLATLASRTGQPLGLLALGEKQSGLPFSTVDRRTVVTLAPPIALAIENDRLRQAVDPALDRAAMECTSCSRLHAPSAVRCACGGTVTEARAPHLLRGVFRFDRRIGAGSMGVVYHAVDLNLRREVAVKTLPQVTPDHVDRLEREAQAMASIVHPNLAVIYGIETWRGIPFLVEEYLAGGTLADRLCEEPMSIDAALDLGMTLAGVLGQLHESGIIHCDIKPSNIGLAQNSVVKLLDFGLVHLLRDSGEAVALMLAAAGEQDTTSMIVTNRGMVGTPAYMSPEAINAQRPAPSFDLWALAVVLYEALAGTRPFEGRDAHAVFASIVGGEFPDLRTRRKGCPDDVALFFNRAFAPDITSRPTGARALADALSTLRQSRL